MESGQGSAKRIKITSGSSGSTPAINASNGQLPRHQPQAGALVSPSNIPSTASLSRTQANGSPSLKFTVKASPNKLRQATSGTNSSTRPYEDQQAASGRGVRSTRNPRKVVEPDSDEDEDEDMEDDEEQELEIEDPDEDEEMDDDEEDAEGEEEDEPRAEPPRPRIQQTTTASGKPKLKVTAPTEGTLQSVESKELEGDDDLSDLDSDSDEILGERPIGLIDYDDDEDLDEDLDDDEDIELDDGDEDASRSATPDPSKLTKRQRGGADDMTGGLMSLSNEAQKKKYISAEEHVMRRAEMARRRKNLSEKRNEEEKIDTINKLLKKPAPKRRSRAEILAAQAAANAGTPGADGEDDDIKPDPLYTRWVNDASGSRLGVPTEWLESPAGESLARRGHALVEEVA